MAIFISTGKLSRAEMPNVVRYWGTYLLVLTHLRTSIFKEV